MTMFEAGMLVEWPGSPGAPIGVVTSVDWPRVHVRMDDGEPKVFNAKVGVITRVHLKGSVRRISTGSIGVLIGEASGTPARWQVAIDGAVRSIAEADLRPHKVETPVSRIVDGDLGTPDQFKLALRAQLAEIDNLANDLVSVNDSRVDLKPHQVSVVHRVVSNYPHRFLLCDEVGLGKTIEAGMALKELRARGAAKRALVIAPPNLVRQWQFELKTKFNETFAILNSSTVKHLRDVQGVDGNPFEAFDSVIVSNRWISGSRWSKAVSEVPWDMVIVDEAHHARVRGKGQSRRETGLYKIVRQLIAPESFSKRAALLLTATPMQLDSGELYSLVELLDPALFPTEQHFDIHRSKVTGLSQLVHELGENSPPEPGPQRDALVAEVAGWLDRDPSEINDDLDRGPGAIDRLCAQLSSRHLLSEVLIRNRKKVIGGFMPRQAHRWEVSLSEAERTALNAVQDYVLRGYAKAEVDKDKAVGFVMVIFQKLMASSIRALRTSLEKRRVKLEAFTSESASQPAARASVDDLETQFEDDEEIDVGVSIANADHADEVHTLKRLIELLDAVPSDSKADSLVTRLNELRTIEPDAKVLVFTEFRGTQEYLKERLEGTGWNVQLFHGQLKPEAKDQAVEAFRTSTEPSILLSTEAGGEGRNFQFCHLLVNYDLPWNPMRVEQRIGRVDRIGQDHPVQIFNFCVKGTVEERVLSVLDSRIKIFEETVGGLDPILGDTEKDLRKIFQMGAEKQDQELQKLERKLEREVEKARKADERLRDFIMETKSYSKEITSALRVNESRLTPMEQESLVIRLLTEVRTHIKRNDDGTFRVIFNEPFRSDSPQHCEGELRSRTVTFRSDEHVDSQHVEFFGPGHPVVSELIARVTSPSFPGTASAFAVDRSTLPAESGWLFIHLITIPGLEEIRELRAAFVDDTGATYPEVAERMLQGISDLSHTRALPIDDVPTASLELALEVAEQAATERLGVLEHGAVDAAREAGEHERRKITEYFAYRETTARDRLASSTQVLSNLEGSEEADKRRAIPMWRARVNDDEQFLVDLASERDRRLLELENKLTPAGDTSLFAAARLVIEAS